MFHASYSSIWLFFIFPNGANHSGLKENGSMETSNASLHDQIDEGCSKRFLTQGTNRWEEMLNTFTYTHHLHATDRSEFPNNLYSHWSGSKWLWTVLHFTCYFFFCVFFVFLLCKHVGATWRCQQCQHDITVTLAHSVFNNIQWSHKEHYKSITARCKTVW